MSKKIPNYEMAYKRFKKPSAVLAEAKMTARHICEDFVDYIDGVRAIYLIHRNKEGGGSNHNRRQMKVITRNAEQFQEELEIFLSIKLTEDEPYRIYSALNARDMKKAIRTFKFEQLNADYYGFNELEDFYIDIKNRFHGCLMQPQSSATSFFLIDCDSLQSFDESQIKLAELGAVIKKQYPTKNGWHIITQPFNPTGFDVKDAELKKDSLILLSY